MKFLHVGDLHLGKSLGDFDLYEDQKYILNQILELIDREDADAILIAGDVYDKSIPSEGATRLLDSFLARLAEKGVKVFMISGNHDSDERLNYGRTLFEHNGIYISGKFSGHLDKYIIKDTGKEDKAADTASHLFHDDKTGSNTANCNSQINIYLLPFVKASQVRHFYPDAKIETYEDAVRTILDSADIDETNLNILVAHQFVAGKGEDPALGGSESAGTQSVGLVEKIGYSCFDKFDYVALGHIHSPQRVGRDAVRYSGSPLKYSLSEVNNEKSVPVITVNGKDDIGIRLVPLRPMRGMRHIKGRMKDLLNKANVTSPEDFIYATLTDEFVINDAMGIFQQTYPNTVKIDYDNSHTREIEQIDIANIVKNKSFSDLICDFYSLMYKCEISEEEMAVMRMAAREAGVSDETN